MNYVAEIRRSCLLFLCTPGCLLIAGFYGLVVATRLHVGHWPYYHHPDAGVWNAVPYPFWHLAVTLLFIATLLSFPVGLLLAAWGRGRAWNWKVIYQYAFWCLVTCLLAIVLLANDPGDFVVWFLD